MAQLKELLVEELQDLLHAEGQLVAALPKMAEAAKHPKLKEAFEKHLIQTEGHVQRLKKAFDLLGEKAEPKPCKAMMGLIEEGKETIEEGAEKDPMIADLALVASAQRVEHYEIAGYGNVKCLARLAGEIEVAKLLTHTLGEEEAADHLLTVISKPILQEAVLDDEEAIGKKTGGRPNKKPNLHSLASDPRRSPQEAVSTPSRAKRN
jgi:Mn-containing catalase